jgi:hypothetical protein
MTAATKDGSARLSHGQGWQGCNPDEKPTFFSKKNLQVL